jgi:hypothetical protein
MKPNQLATLALRLMGVYTIIQGIPVLGMLTGMVAFAQRSGELSVAGATAMAILPGLGLLAIGILLLVFSVPLGEKLARSAGEDAGVTLVSFELVQVLAFAVAGVLIFAGALPNLLNRISYLVQWLTAGKDDAFPRGSFVLGEVLSAVGTIAQAALGLILFFGARGFCSFWRAMRTAGTTKPPPTDAG